jgi:hypothetical protein
MPTIPPERYLEGEARAVYPRCDRTGRFGIALNLSDGTVVRYHLSEESARFLAEGLSEVIQAKAAEQKLAAIADLV